VSVEAADIARIVQDVWSQVLNLEAQPAEDEGPCELTGCIQITGAWRGAVVVSMPRQLARLAAAAMFQIEAAAVGEDECRDALGELTNMLGGHVKAMVASPSQLALPAVVPGSDHCLRQGRLELMAEQDMSCQGLGFVVQVLEDIG
jgi:chemotaxis protein CheX